eukprot:6214732-Pyramimonas_sp.AAC.3
MNKCCKRAEFAKTTAKARVVGSRGGGTRYSVHLPELQLAQFLRGCQVALGAVQLVKQERTLVAAGGCHVRRAHQNLASASQVPRAPPHLRLRFDNNIAQTTITLCEEQVLNP